MNEWDKLQAENEARRKDVIKRRHESAEQEIRIMHEFKKLLIGFVFIFAALAVAAFIFKFFN